MLPSEVVLMARGWPRKARAGGSGSGSGSGSDDDGAAAGGGSSGSGSGAGVARRAASPGEAAAAAAADVAGAVAAARRAAAGAAGVTVDLESLDEAEFAEPGARWARLLHRARRAERALLSYERAGWLDDTPARATGRLEVRPAAELGPIILCLDTSGSMRGARELVAKALALECMRGAHRQRRKCYLYAFSGPEQVQELELGVDDASLHKLLDFLQCE